MFGGVGKDDGDYHNDLWALSGPTWTLLDSG